MHIKKLLFWAGLLLFALPLAGQITVDLGSDIVICEGETIVLNSTVTGGDGNYTYTWTPAAGLNCTDCPNTTAFPTTTTTYILTVEDGLGEQGSDDIEIIVSPPPVIDEDASTVTDATCQGSATGAIDLVTEGGTAPYTYLWIGPDGFTASSQNITNLSPGTYTVTITDGQGCADDASFTVAGNNSIEVTFEITPPGCDATVVGEIDITVTGGTPGYTYEWSTGETTEDILFTEGGTYFVTVIDANGCALEQFFNVIGGNPTLNATVQDVSCNGGNDGFIQVTSPDGVSFEWTDGFNGPVRQGLAPDEYCVLVTNGSGCTTEECYIVSEPEVLVLIVDSTDETCAGAGDGTLTAFVTGGTPPYVYIWANGTTTQQITNLAAGVYTITVTDSNGCQVQGTGIIEAGSTFNVNIGGIPTEPCVSEFTLTAEVVPSGIYTYIWEIDGVVVSTSDQLVNPGTGQIQLVVTNEFGCTIAQAFQYDPLPFVSIGSNAILDCATNSVELDGSNSSGGPDYTYLWEGPDGFTSDQAVVTVNAPGLYTLTVENSSIAGCTNSGSIFVQDLSQEFDPGITTTLTGCNQYELMGYTPPNYPGEVAFQWTYPDGTTTSTEQTIIPTQTGVYTLHTAPLGTTCNFYYTVYVDLEADACATIRGNVFNDISEVCLQETTDPTLEGFLITAVFDGQTFNALSNADGYYEISVPATTGVVTASSPSSSWEACMDVISVNSPLADGEVFDANFWFTSVVQCPELDISLSASFLRRCFSSNYFITVTNTGTEVAADAEVTLVMDDFLSYINSSITPVGVVDQTILWNIGTLLPNQTVTFWVRVQVSCDAELGQVHCSEVFVTPDPLCVPAQDWTGTNLELNTACDGTDVVFTVRNTGNSDLSEPVNYIVIEDGVAMMQPQTLESLGAGQEETFSFPANGSTYTFQIDQVDNHPYSELLSLSIEGCGTNEAGQFSTGFATQFGQTTATVAQDVFCLENVGSYDPNDKAALPIGYGEQHYIVPETELYYRIRFQNTGTDTAFTVVVRDVLSDHLDIGTFRLGNSSHDYDFDINGDRELTFTFNNILLPDSTTNLEASQGFLDFRISPDVSTPLETVIENSAAIYFDFNDPIITNTVFHTLGRNFLEVVNTEVVAGVDIRWNVFPNPVADQLEMTLAGELPEQMQLQVLDAQGRALRTQTLRGTTHTISVVELPAGWYQLRLTNKQGALLGTSEIVKK